MTDNDWGVIIAFNVYVIELDKEVIKSKKFRDRNPYLKPNKACFYVGQTCHDPITRFKQHKEGYKSNSFVKRYGLRLLRRKYIRYNPIGTHEEAEKIEQELADHLRKKGHDVLSN